MNLATRTVSVQNCLKNTKWNRNSKSSSGLSKSEKSIPFAISMDCTELQIKLKGGRTQQDTKQAHVWMTRYYLQDCPELPKPFLKLDYEDLIRSWETLLQNAKEQEDHMNHQITTKQRTISKLDFSSSIVPVNSSKQSLCFKKWRVVKKKRNG